MSAGCGHERFIQMADAWCSECVEKLQAELISWRLHGQLLTDILDGHLGTTRPEYHTFEGFRTKLSEELRCLRKVAEQAVGDEESVEILSVQVADLKAEVERLRGLFGGIFCVECGPHVRIDEDGCCVHCGNYAEVSDIARKAALDMEAE